MASEEQIQEPADFGEVCVTLVEEKHFLLDPHLFALSGNNIEQYCTMLSLLEFQNPKPEMFILTEQGVEMPLSLVKVVEDFEVGSWSYQGGDETTQTMQFDPLQQGCPAPDVRVQYNFVQESEGDVLQEKSLDCLPVSELQQRTPLQTGGYESFLSTGKNLSMSSQQPQAHPPGKGLMGDLKAVIPQQEESQQTNMRGLAVAQPNEWIAPQISDHGAAEASIRQIIPTREQSHSSDDTEEHINEQLSSLVQPTACYKCPDDEHSSRCGPTGVTGQQTISMDEWEKLFSHLSLNSVHNQMEERVEKPFRCPDCGKGFLHQSSIPRHQRLHRKENALPISGQKQSIKPLLNCLPCQKAPLGKELLQRAGGGTSLINGCAAKPSHRCNHCAVECKVCGQRYAKASQLQKHLGPHSKEKPFHCSDCGKQFPLRSTLLRHEMLHLPEKPFKCLYCDKSYIQKNHLNRHCQKYHAYTN